MPTLNRPSPSLLGLKASRDREAGCCRESSSLRRRTSSSYGDKEPSGLDGGGAAVPRPTSARPSSAFPSCFSASRSSHHPWPLAQVALAVLAALRLSAAEADARLRVLLLATHVLAGTTVLLASLSARQRYAAARPYLLLAVRVAHDVLWTGLLWHSTAADRVAARSAGDQSWAGEAMWTGGATAAALGCAAGLCCVCLLAARRPTL